MNYQYGNRFRSAGAFCPSAGRTAAAPSPASYNGTPVDTKTGVSAVNQLGVAPTDNAPVTSLAMVYSPTQVFRDLYEPCKALARGTLFAELDKPFQGAFCERRPS